MIMWNKIIKRFLTFVPIILPNGNEVKPLYKFLQNILCKVKKTHGKQTDLALKI